MPTYRQNSMNPATILGGEAAIVTPADARMHILNRVGTRVWELCDGAGADDASIVARLCDEFDGPPDVIAAETRAFLAEGSRLGLLVVDDAPAGQ